jgi:hypothetical protein
MIKSCILVVIALLLAFMRATVAIGSVVLGLKP